MEALPPDDPYYNPERTGLSWEERTFDPDTFSAGFGRIVVRFSELERYLSLGIGSCLALDEPLGRIVCSELSFKVKLHMLSSLVRHLSASASRRFNVGSRDPIECWSKISAQCFHAEDLRNQVLHSEWSGPNRLKVTAKASRGLTETVEAVDAARLLDIADYIALVSVFVDEYFIPIDA